MSDSSNAPTPPHMNNTLNVVLALIVLAFNAILILYCVYYGNPANSLHTSAMAWAFGTSILILAGFGIGSKLPDLVSALTGKTP